MLLTYSPGSAVPDCLILVFERADEKFKCVTHYTGQLLVAGAIQNGAKGKGGCLPTSPVLWAASFADVFLSSRRAQTSAGSAGSCMAGPCHEAYYHSMCCRAAACQRLYTWHEAKAAGNASCRAAACLRLNQAACRVPSKEAVSACMHVSIAHFTFTLPQCAAILCCKIKQVKKAS